MSAINYPPDLPIVARRKEIIEAIRANQVLIVAGETGSGKTTQLPKMCLEAGRGRHRKIGCTQPRRIAAITVAERVAEELADMRNLVGSKVRFRDQTSRATRIKFMTDGILLAEAQQDKKLAAYDTIIVDEAHERSLNIDFLLGLLRRLLERRPDLKLIITSATIDTEKFAAAFGGAPVIEVSGRSFPVEVRYQPIDPAREEEGELSYVDQAVAVVVALAQEPGGGDILVFVPTERDINETVEGIRAAFAVGQKAGAGPLVLPLFGRLSAGNQRKVFQPAKVRKIVVATNVAETSITVPGIRYVVDTGLARLAMYNVRARTSKLPVLPISQAACDQRKGRCGRLGPGICIRLYSEEDYLNRPRFTPPEILRTNLAAVILRMTAIGLGDPARFPFIDPPSGRAIKDGYELLRELNAIDASRRLTETGRLMSRLPLDPRVSRMIIEAREHNALREVMVIASALSIQDPRLRPPGREAAADAAHARFREGAPSDFLFFLALWDAYHGTLSRLNSLSKMRKFCNSHFLSFSRMREWQDIYEQIATILAEEPGFAVNVLPAPPDAVHRAILAGNLRNIGLKKEKNLYQAGGGREVMVFPGSSRYGKTGQWIMAAEFVETSRLYARTVADIEPEWIESLAGDLCRSTYSEPHWEKGRGQVIACQRVTLFGLPIVARRKVNFGPLDPKASRQIFIQTALIEGELRGTYRFLKQNRALLAKIEEMEDRLRLRDIVVDEQALFAFYDMRLSPEVCDQRSLNRSLKEAGAEARLSMTEEDILQKTPDAARLEQFPLSLEVAGFVIPLSYRFAPGEEDDGVSAMIPLGVLPHLSREAFEWLVPGLLTEKLVFLLKGLPKAIRRQLVPVPQTAAVLAGDLLRHREAGRLSLYRLLEALLRNSWGLRVGPEDWPIAELPPHLRFRFCLLDGRGKIIRTTRDFAELEGCTAPPGTGIDPARLRALQKQWEGVLSGPADLRALPDSLPVSTERGKLQGYLYPALVSLEGGGVGQSLVFSREEARHKSAQALLALYRAEFARQFKGLKKEVGLSRSAWALYEGFGSKEQLDQAMWDWVLTQVFHLDRGTSPSAEEFAATVREVAERGLVPLCRKLFDRLIEVLTERRQTLDTIRTSAAACRVRAEEDPRHAEYLHCLEQIVPPDFPAGLDAAKLPPLCRYLKALRIRVERARLSPAKDAERATSLRLHLNRLLEADRLPDRSADFNASLDEYKEMIEEFKVSLFAQELGTAYPVSEKRLEKKWQELRLLG